MLAPASAYASSVSQAPSPAPDSIRTSRPAARSLTTASGTSATRRSPGAVSLTTDTFMHRPRSVGRGKNAAWLPGRTVKYGPYRHATSDAVDQRTLVGL